ncbi:MAG: PEP-CTERM sorting domain-containing protein, partial [Bryobacterales bacterium]|nr:PEP-CTERM sorting domain-containing protein [Bryobacterales bacterium]
GMHDITLGGSAAPPEIPEPSTMLLTLSAAGALWLRRRFAA